MNKRKLYCFVGTAHNLGIWAKMTGCRMSYDRGEKNWTNENLLANEDPESFGVAKLWLTDNQALQIKKMLESSPARHVIIFARILAGDCKPGEIVEGPDPLNN